MSNVVTLNNFTAVILIITPFVLQMRTNLRTAASTRCKMVLPMMNVESNAPLAGQCCN